MSKFIKKI